ncbi:MAG TPA: DUF4416 family protein [Anaerolineae bacterium]|nr:DUF4416 family protein [Anaerolineae bacterium]
MGTAHPPEPVKLVFGLLGSSPELLDQAVERLRLTFGPLEERSEPLPFTHTRYYARELGDRPWRQFVTQVELVDPGDLATIKIRTNELELGWATGGRRPINIDPGYVSLSKLVLASTKNHWHRIYIGQGIYAEATLPFREGAFQPQEWTYPDYRTPESLAFFTAVRERYRRQLRALPEAAAAPGQGRTGTRP